MITHFDNVTSMTGMITEANDLTGGILMPVFAVLVWLVIAALWLAQGRGQAITGASAITFIVLLLENMAGLSPWWLLVVDAVLLAVGVVMMFVERG